MSRGRPQFKPTAAQKQRVSVAAAYGVAHDDIALSLGISRTTLLKHFDHELSIGAIQRRMEVLSAMHKAAKGGNVAAAKALLQTTPRTTVPRVGDVGEEQQKPAPKVGKKEQAQADAAQAAEGTEWDSLLKPSTVQ